MKHPKLNEYITVQVTTEDYSSGDLVVRNDSSFSFWGNVQEMKSPATASGNSSFTQTGSRLRNHKLVMITARVRDIDQLEMGSELTIDNDDDVYSVTDIYDKVHKHYVEIIAEYRN